MEANIIFNNVKAYNVIKFDVKLGESFKVELINAPDFVRWFSDNDAVLNITVLENGNFAEIKATAVGKSEIQLQDSGRISKTLDIEVYDQVAVALNPSAGNPELK